MKSVLYVKDVPHWDVVHDVCRVQAESSKIATQNRSQKKWCETTTIAENGWWTTLVTIVFVTECLADGTSTLTFTLAVSLIDSQREMLCEDAMFFQ